MTTTPHVIASSSNHATQPATTTGVVGNHFRVGKKIGEGSFGVVFEGIYSFFFNTLSSPRSVLAHSGVNLLTNQPIAIKFVSNPNFDRNPCLTGGRPIGTSQVGRTSITR
jgi:casein kinase 1